MITKHLRMVRGQTLRLTFTVKDEDGIPVDLTGASAYLHIRPDIKAAAIIQLSSPASGITISTPQTGSTKGEFVAVVGHAATASVTPGDYVYDCWVVLASGDRLPVVSESRLTIQPNVTTIA